MAEIINLHTARKAKARGEKDVKAEENRVLFGRPKKAKTPGLERGLAQLLENVRLCVAQKGAHAQNAQKLFAK